MRKIWTCKINVQRVEEYIAARGKRKRALWGRAGGKGADKEGT